MGFRAMVRAVGLEPTRRCHRGILSPLRLPVPPRPHIDSHSLFAFWPQMFYGYFLVFCETAFTACFTRPNARGFRGALERRAASGIESRRCDPRAEFSYSSTR